ncbi:ComEA family DNA-binding protein [Marivirga tractuosa]|nr:helix-hairpin-helix domain-containing protein [Marivirga tractuosa]
MPFISKSIYSYYKKPVQSKAHRLNLNSLLSELKDNIETHNEKSEEREYNYFDLNKSTSAELVNSGFPQYLAKRIVKYRNKVNPFESKDELLKIYGIDSAFYQEIYPYIKITILNIQPDPQPVKKETSTTNKIKEEKYPEKEAKKFELSAFDLNKADSTQLQKIYGIGPAYSKRILKYRNYLGGFHSLNQLNEVYGLKKENLDSLKNYVFLANELNLRKLKVNKLNADSLVQHPYISYKEANLIVNYRNQHGNYSSMDDILAIKILDSIWVKKTAPYLSFD